MDLIYDQVLQDYGAVTFEAFINLLVVYCPYSYPFRESHDGTGHHHGGPDIS